MKKTTVYAEISKEYLYEKGTKLGLGGEALDMFICFTEIELAIEVDDTGVVRDVKALWMEVE